MRTKYKTSPIKKIKNVGDEQKPIIQFEYQGTTYQMQYFADSCLHRESDNLKSVVYDREKGLHTITTKSDFGGLGKDAAKLHIVPLQSWLNFYCKVVS